MSLETILNISLNKYFTNNLFLTTKPYPQCFEKPSQLITISLHLSY